MRFPMTKKQKKMLIRICIAIVLLLIAKFVPMPGAVRIVLFAVTYLVIGYDILKKAFKGILNKQVFDENFLMTVASIGAFCIGKYPEAVAVMLLYEIGEWLQDKAVGSSRASIEALVNVRPDHANLVKGDEVTTVKAETVSVGDIILVPRSLFRSAIRPM